MRDLLKPLIFDRSDAARRLTVGALFALAIAWVYRGVFVELAGRWANDPAYSHGYLVPLYAVVILWFQREKIAGESAKPSWLAVVLVGIAAILYVGGTVFYFTWLVQLSLLPILAAAFLAVGGRPYLGWAWPAILFLLFMIPLPARLDEPLARPLQRIATRASTNALQTFGIFAEAEGNIILLRDSELGIVEACSGLRMLLMFFAASTAVAIFLNRSWYHKVILIVSAVPIALFCNIARITLTGVLRETVSFRSGDAFFHDLAGLLMIPLALVLLAAELWFLSRLFPRDDPERHAPLAPLVRPSDRVAEKQMETGNGKTGQNQPPSTSPPKRGTTSTPSHLGTPAR